MKDYAVIIPTRTVKNAVQSSSSATALNVGSSIFIIDDTDDQANALEGHGRVIPGIKPFIFSRNMNLGIVAAGRRDVILMNDDSVLMTERGFDEMVAYANTEAAAKFGVISTRILGMAAATEQVVRGYRNTGSNQQEGPMWKVRHHMVAFVCVLIRRDVLDLVGVLDERFDGYGYEDDDYCLRVRNAGLEIGVFDPCIVEHGTKAESTYRGPGAAGRNLLDHNRQKFNEKWGVKP